MRISRLCRDLFFLANAGPEPGALPSGARWEQRIADYLARFCVPSTTYPGGFSLFGNVSLSGLQHQVDSSIRCENALVIAEWKSHREMLPKNELIRFKAVTDDFYMNLTASPQSRPIIRIFCGTGAAPESLRRYAALHGILIIEPGRWPSAVLAGSSVDWGGWDFGPGQADRETMAWMSRPMQDVMLPQPMGSFILPRPPNPLRVDAALRVQDYWSDRLWERMDYFPLNGEETINYQLGF